MPSNETLEMRGTLRIEVHCDGRLIEERIVPNLITTKGRELVAGLLSGSITGPPTLSIKAGNSDTAAEKAQTNLQGTDITTATASASVADTTVNVKATLSKPAAGSKRELKEAGIFVSIGSGATLMTWMYNRTTFAVITQTDAADVTLTWEVKF